MRIQIEPEWLSSRAHLEEGCEIGAGFPGSFDEWVERFRTQSEKGQTSPLGMIQRRDGARNEPTSSSAEDL